MSHWDFGRPTGGQHDTQEPDDRGYLPDLGYPPDGDWSARESGPADAQWPPPDEHASPDGEPWSDGEAWPAQDPWAANRRRPAAERWSPGGGLPADNGWAEGGSADGDWAGNGDDWDDEDDEDGTAPYPLTYERDDFAQLGSEPPLPPQVPWEPWPTAPDPGVAAVPPPPGYPGAGAWSGPRPGDDAAGGPRDTGRGRASGRGARRNREPAGWPDQDPVSAPAPAPTGDDPADWMAVGRRRPAWAGRGNRRWLILAGIAVAGAAVGASAVLLGGGHPRAQAADAPAARPDATPDAAASTPTAATPSATGTPSAAAGTLTLAQAQSVVAGYTTVNNGANAQRSASMLATIETGSSYAIDAALYQMQRAAGSAPYPAFAPARATFYIPRDQPAGGPRWFAVLVGNAFSTAPKKVTSTEYLLFTQSAPGGPWQNAVEPYLLPGASSPQVAVGPDGLATAVSPDAATVAVAPGQLPTATAAALDGTSTGTGTGTSTGQASIANPGNLADLSDQKQWQGKLPGGQVTDAHTPATGTDGQEFAVATTDGGALVFYTDAAEVTLTPPAGSALNLTIPGLFSPSQSLPRAGVGFLEQFAAYDPPAGQGAPRVVADYSGITGKS